MKTLQRYLRAFFLALKMTLRGEKLPEPVRSPLAIWTQQLDTLVSEVYRAAENSGMNLATRQSTKIRIDSRPVSVETILAHMRFHARQEYPSLLSHVLTNEITNTVYASNMNDHYWLIRLQAADEMQQPEVQAALAKLEAHLQAVPRNE